MTANIERAGAQSGSEVVRSESEVVRSGSEVQSGSDLGDVVAQIRELAEDHDPAAVQRIVADVLAALDRAILNSSRQESWLPWPSPTPSPGADGGSDDRAPDATSPTSRDPRSADE